MKTSKSKFIFLLIPFLLVGCEQARVSTSSSSIETDTKIVKDYSESDINLIGKHTQNSIDILSEVENNNVFSRANNVTPIEEGYPSAEAYSLKVNGKLSLDKNKVNYDIEDIFRIDVLTFGKLYITARSITEKVNLDLYRLDSDDFGNNYAAYMESGYYEDETSYYLGDLSAGVYFIKLSLDTSALTTATTIQYSLNINYDFELASDIELSKSEYLTSDKALIWKSKYNLASVKPLTSMEKVLIQSNESDLDFPFATYLQENMAYPYADIYIWDENLKQAIAQVFTSIDEHLELVIDRDMEDGDSLDTKFKLGIHPSFSEDEVSVKFTIKDIDDKVLEEWTENFSLTEGSILFSNDQELTSLFMKENTITGLDFLLMCDKVISALETNRDVLKLSSFFKIVEENGEKYVFFGYDFSSQRDAVESLPISESLVKTRKDGTLFFGDMYPISTGDDVAEALK